MKIGIMTPLYGRPDFARYAAMQFAMQTRKPDHVAFYQNGEFPDYQWAISDLTLPYKAYWIYSNKTEPSQSSWYVTPLKQLLDAKCDYIFWCDQDDMYRATHIEETIQDFEREHADIVLNKTGGLLKIRPKKFDLHPPIVYCRGEGMSSSLAFNADAARSLHADLTEHVGNTQLPADGVVHNITMKKFKVYRNPTRASVIYTCHEGTVSSAHWLEGF
jgi:hypothetical protein